MTPAELAKDNTAFLLWLWFTDYKFTEIIKLGWRAYE